MTIKFTAATKSIIKTLNNWIKQAKDLEPDGIRVQAVINHCTELVIELSSKDRDYFIIPTVEKLHTQILRKLKQDSRLLDMRYYDGNHIVNTTTNKREQCHCYAGWVLAFSGAEGRALDTSMWTCETAYLILAANYPKIQVPLLWADNATGLRQIQTAAKMEK